jgi:hypothetical protein
MINNLVKMKTFYTPQSSINEACLWVNDGTRNVCITYKYNPHTGDIIYAASVLNNGENDPTDEQITNHENTTTRRFNIRPIATTFESYLTYKNLIKTIRREMCHGLGCVGIRGPIKRSDDTESLSSVEMMNDECDDFNVSDDIYSKPVVYFKYYWVTNESHGDYSHTLRTVFVCFKGSSINGNLLYGACIAHSPAHSDDEYDKPDIDDDSHYETAMMRLEKCPIHMVIQNEYRSQLDKRTDTDIEDVTHMIMNKILKRVRGCFQIKGNRYNHIEHIYKKPTIIVFP